MFLCLHWSVWGQSGGWEYRYWFDGDDNNPHTGTSASDSWQLDAGLDALSGSMHSFHMQVKDADGVWSSPVTRYFVKSATAGLPVHYWYDGDASDRYLLDGKYTAGVVDIDVSRLTDGFHLICFQAADKYSTSSPATTMFIKIPQTEGVSHITCRCLIDGQLYLQEKVPSSGGIVSWNFDVSSLSQGLHRVQIQAVTPSGAATNISEQFFFRSTTAAEFANMRLLYTVDGDKFYTEAGRYADGLYHFDIDVAGLEDGLHKLAYMLTSESGASTKVSTSFFMKTPLGGPGITTYRYWLNEDETAMHTVALDERKDPFCLITLLPVETCPIRSSAFKFEIEDGLPVIYAKNDIHFQFFDVSGRMAETSQQYVDYNIGCPVENIAQLKSGVRHTSAKPAANGINWYEVTAVKGDSLTFKADKACTLQLFSPSGNEVYSASGATSVAVGGCHAYEDGTYYLALHDIKGTSGYDISVDYQHIDKYVVLSHSPKSVGVSPCAFTMNLDGNGFDKLLSAELISETQTIKADTFL